MIWDSPFIKGDIYLRICTVHPTMSEHTANQSNNKEASVSSHKSSEKKTEQEKSEKKTEPAKTESVKSKSTTGSKLAAEQAAKEKKEKEEKLKKEAFTIITNELKDSNITDQIQQTATELKENAELKAVTTKFKDVLEKNFGRGWNVIAGKHFTGLCSYETGFMIQFQLYDYMVVIFKVYVTKGQ